MAAEDGAAEELPPKKEPNMEWKESAAWYREAAAVRNPLPERKNAGEASGCTGGLVEAKDAGSSAASEAGSFLFAERAA